MKRASTFLSTLLSALCAFALLTLSASVHAQLYKSVGPDGKVTYTDTPPSSTKQAKPVSAGGGDNANPLPYELAEAAKNHPVTIYTSNNCAPCDQGRALLTERGVPFSEKTVSSGEDSAKLKEATGETQVPMLLVGRNKLKGYSQSNWNNALTAAGYPASSKLPKTFRNPPAATAAPRAGEESGRGSDARQGEPVTTSREEDVQPPAGNAPPGFRF